MPRLRAVATALPDHRIAQADIREAARAHFAPAFPQIDRYLPVFHNSQIDQRFFAAPLEWFQQPRSLKECNDRFIQVGSNLGEQVARACLAQAALDGHAIDHLIWVSTTGMAAPSPDATLIGRLGMRRTTRRTPIWGLGCAGGIAGLARANEYVQAFPHHRALLLCVELCSVTFQWEDRSRRNLIAASLFADGAAGILLEGDAIASSGPQIIATQSLIWPDTQDVMGWEIIDSGMQVVFSARIPGMISSEMHGIVAEFLATHGLSLSDIRHWILHPGGAKVIAAYESALAIGPTETAHTRSVLRSHGNMSSGTVFFVLKACLHAGIAPGEYGLLAVLGPGFSCELALIQG
jgi:alkylresorcinol/alkylpyrone synthase